MLDFIGELDNSCNNNNNNNNKIRKINKKRKMSIVILVGKN